MKKNYLHLALLGIGALVVLIYLMRKLSAADAGSNGALVSDAAVSQPPSYPNSQPIKLGDISVGGSPVNITYNTSPDSQPASGVTVKGALPAGAGCGCSDSCGSTVAGQIVGTNVIPESVLNASVANFSGYQQKGARFSQAPVVPINGEGGGLNI